MPESRSAYSGFLQQLVAAGFIGDIGDLIDPVVYATDNSIYEVRPQAVIYPRTGEDLKRLLSLAAQPRFAGISFAPRGGGTGANGQSLTDGVVIDLSRHMNRVVELDADQRLVIVEPGVVLDQLNSYLKPYGLFFPPTVSTSSRATLGGMVGTDASGKGSRVYGKTSDWIAKLDVVLDDGTPWTFEPVSVEALEKLKRRDDRIGEIYRQIHASVSERRDLIESTFPEMNRGLTGYNLKQALQPDGGLNPCYLIAGSEGTLCVIQRIVCRVSPIPREAALIAVRYRELSDAVGDIPNLLQADPHAIEFIDDKVLGEAQNDSAWRSVSAAVGGDSGKRLGGMNFVEVVGHSKSAVASGVQRVVKQLEAMQSSAGSAIGWQIAQTPVAIAAVWEFRKQAQGLLASMGGTRRAIPFIEDSAVPPENLPAYIAELRELLVRHDVDAGMFGHADVGCLHVRPMLDLEVPEDVSRLRRISDEVVDLVTRHGGLLWGEHGKGYRGEYSPQVFGAELFDELRKLKGIFDPGNRLNPGKIATPMDDSATRLLKIDEVPLRAQTDARISREGREHYPGALRCNGNGACFSWQVDAILCPSYKVTGDRVQSPKGRAMLLREWLRLCADAPAEADRFAEQIWPALNSCFACKACANSCPVMVDIPDMRSRFLSAFYQKRRRPLRDYLIAGIERFAPLLSPAAPLVNAVQSLPGVSSLVRQGLGLTALPRYSVPGLQQRLKNAGAMPFSLATLEGLSPVERNKTVVIVADCFNRFYDAEVVLATYKVLVSIGFNPCIAPYWPNGKPQHVKGFLDAFERTAVVAAESLRAIAKTGVSLVALDGAMNFVYRHEYVQLLGAKAVPEVPLMNEWLVERLEQLPSVVSQKTGGKSYRLLRHCTEVTVTPDSGVEWRRIFAHFGLRLEEERVGCCGMSGVFGHETANQAVSEHSYALSWRQPINDFGTDRVLATGFSCRSQVKRFEGERVRHPVEILAASFDSATPS